MIVIGADTHKSTHALAAVDAGTGQVVGEREIAADDGGHRQALQWARQLDPDAWRPSDASSASSHATSTPSSYSHQQAPTPECKTPLAERPTFHRSGGSIRSDEVVPAHPRVIVARANELGRCAGGLDPSLIVPNT
ncbi:MAG TPA: hypothetical protein VK691_04645 [Solirubrobacteraceae bacterium]|jgi:hypothetical protein|nr:hypothetical protein [Solirubrobacteraceae bacterium]